MITKEEISEIDHLIVKGIMTEKNISSISNPSEVKKRVGDAFGKLDLKFTKEKLLEYIKLIGNEVFQEANAKLQATEFSKK